MAGEKRKSRASTNEKNSKREKKSNNSIVSSASNEEIDEQASIHSNASTGESNNPVEETVETNEREIEEVEPITTVNVNVEHEIEEIDNSVESTPLVDVEVHPTNKENRSTTKSWWSSLTRFFHFGYSNNESKTPLESNNDLQSSPYVNGSYLSNVKPRRNLHDESLLG